MGAIASANRMLIWLPDIFSTACVGYDLLYGDLTPEERERYRNKIAHQGHLLYEFFEPRPGRSWAYSQNHTFIPMAGLGVAGIRGIWRGAGGEAVGSVVARDL